MDNQIDPVISFQDFMKVDIRAGRILSAEEFKEARKPAIKLVIDFGVLGKKKSSAQITHYYSPKDLVGKIVLAVVNFPPKQIANFMSEVLVLGFPDREGRTVLVSPDLDVEPGSRLK